MSFQRLPRKRGEKVIFFFENLSLLPETREVKEHFKLVFGSGTSDLAKIRPLKNRDPRHYLEVIALWELQKNNKQNVNKPTSTPQPAVPQIPPPEIHAKTPPNPEAEGGI